MKRVICVLAAAMVVACASAPTAPAKPPEPTSTAQAPSPTTAKPAPGAPAMAAPRQAPAAPATASQPPSGPRPGDQATPPEGVRPDRPTPGEGPPEPKPYDRVITKEARSTSGVFTVHRIKEKVYYEIPKQELGKDFLWVSQIAKTTLGVGYGGQALGNRVVRWERKDNRVLLRNVSYDVVADPKQPIAQAVQAANNDTIIMAFNVEAVGKDEAPVIDVTRLFTTDVPEFSARARLRARAFEPAARSSSASVVPREHRGGSDPHLHVAHRPAVRRPRGRCAAQPVHRLRHAARQRDRADALQHGEAAREADDAAPLRRARRLLHGSGRWTTAGTSTGRRNGPTSRAGASRRRIRTRRSPSR